MYKTLPFNLTLMLSCKVHYNKTAIKHNVCQLSVSLSLELISLANVFGPITLTLLSVLDTLPEAGISNLPADAQSVEGLETMLCELDCNQSTLPVLVVYRTPAASTKYDCGLLKALEFAADRRHAYLILGEFKEPNVF